MKARTFRFLYTFALVAIVAASASACAQEQALKAETIISNPSVTDTVSGNYLAGRFAQRQQDWGTAQGYMGAVLDHDRNNDALLQRTFLLALGSGHFAKAAGLAKRVVGMKGNAELAMIFLSCEAIGRDDFKTALAYLDKLPEEGFGQYTKPLLSAWALVGLGHKDEALKLLASTSSPDDPTYRMHVGMMEEMTGNMNAAADNYKVAMANGLNLHTAVMTGNFFERYGQPEITRSIYEGLDKIHPFSPFISELAGRDPHRVIVPNITRPADGAALALFDLADLLYEKRAYESAQIYGSMVQLLDPKSPFAMLMMGDIAALHDQYPAALQNYRGIGKESPIFWLARMRIAEVYEVSGQLDQSVNTLTELSQDPAMHLQALTSLGDTYRRHDQYENAIEAYNHALDGVATLTKEHWPVIYARGIAEEHLNRWNLAEKDLLKALDFQPENPMILNFIAYSWANQGVKLDQALAYAKRAAALRPDDGYILDSYGWTLFRMTQYKESITWLEQAVAQVPNDSTLLDHLGDAYWQVGRQSEARYQWKHANDLSQDPSFKMIVQQKLQHGIVVPSQVAHKEAKL